MITRSSSANKVITYTKAGINATMQLMSRFGGIAFGPAGAIAGAVFAIVEGVANLVNSTYWAEFNQFNGFVFTDLPFKEEEALALSAEVRRSVRSEQESTKTAKANFSNEGLANRLKRVFSDDNFKKYSLLVIMLSAAFLVVFYLIRKMR